MDIYNTNWNYILHGRDWDGLSHTCGTHLNQSPINLISDNSKDFEKYTKLSIDEDDYNSSYTNLKNAKVTWNGFTSSILINQQPEETTSRSVAFRQEYYNLDLHGNNNYFSSKIPVKFWGARDTSVDFYASDISFHSKSEHTIDGNSFDLEMQIMYITKVTDLRKGESLVYQYAGVAVLFSEKDFTAELSESDQLIIDDFFESL